MLGVRYGVRDAHANGGARPPRTLAGPVPRCRRMKPTAVVMLRSTRGPHAQLEVEDPVPWLLTTQAKPLDQQLDNALGHSAHGLRERGQGRFDHLRPERIVDTYEGHLPRYANAMHVQRSQRTQGHQVIAGD